MWGPSQHVWWSFAAANDYQPRHRCDCKVRNERRDPPSLRGTPLTLALNANSRPINMSCLCWLTRECHRSVWPKVSGIRMPGFQCHEILFFLLARWRESYVR